MGEGKEAGKCGGRRGYKVLELLTHHDLVADGLRTGLSRMIIMVVNKIRKNGNVNLKRKSVPCALPTGNTEQIQAKGDIYGAARLATAQTTPGGETDG